jgi:hypothetical protein
MNEDNLLKVYEEYMSLTGKLLSEDANALELAPIMIKIGLEIYKTVMSKEDFDRMVDYISDCRGDVRNLSEFLPEIH